MSLIAMSGITLDFRGRTLFEDESLSVDRGDRLGIVGRNGTGKSTLLRIMVGEVHPDAGEVKIARSARLGYLPQELDAGGDVRLLDSLLERAPGRADVELRVADLEAEIARTPDEARQLELSGLLADEHARLVELDQRYAPHRAERILVGLGFGERDLARPVREFSGGYRMRAALGGILFEDPDILLLDEPTNHLDLPSVRWLSGFLHASKKALVLICHDRTFLNRHINKVASLEIEGIRQYRGNYDEYLVQREAELELLENRQRRDEARKKELEAFVDRFRAKASKARQAQSKAKLIEKMSERVIELPKIERSISLRFKPTARCGERAVLVEGLGFAYPGQSRPIFSGLDLTIRRGDRIAIVGPNGMGKTTLLKLIGGELTPAAGKVELGHLVKPSYFAQHHAEGLDTTHTVFEETRLAARTLNDVEVRGILGAFLFSGDDVDKSISVLSGGERARVALAKLLADPGNLILLDEPTNHLDTDAAEKLTTSLESYDGTLVFVSHNLDFGRRLSNQVWRVENGKVEVFPGSLGEFLDRLDLEEAESKAVAAERPLEPERLDKAARIEARERDKREKNEQKKRLTTAKKTVAEAEAKIAALEAEMRALEVELADPTRLQSADGARAASTRYRAATDALEAEMARWEEASTEVARLEGAA